MTRAELAALFRGQAGWCGRLGSPLYEHLLDKAAADLESGGPVWRIVAPYIDEPFNFTHHLRLLAATHRLALAGEAPALADAYARRDSAAAWAAFHELIEHREIKLDQAIQTNEVGRCAALLGGFLTIAELTGLGLRVLELGASAGLNLRWDRFRYEAPDWAYGDADSPLRIPCEYQPDGRPPLSAAVWVMERAGCDPSPIDPTSVDGALWLQSFVWPGQTERMNLLRAALEVARRTPVTVEQASGPDWLAAQLARERAGSATVVYHSIVWGYMTDDDRARIVQTMIEAGDRATAAEPLAWLRMEPGADQTDVTLTLWPDADERVIATAGFHGRPVSWRGW